MEQHHVVPIHPEPTSRVQEGGDEEDDDHHRPRSMFASPVQHVLPRNVFDDGGRERKEATTMDVHAGDLGSWARGGKCASIVVVSRDASPSVHGGLLVQRISPPSAPSENGQWYTRQFFAVRAFEAYEAPRQWGSGSAHYCCSSETGNALRALRSRTRMTLCVVCIAAAHAG